MYTINDLVVLMQQALFDTQDSQGRPLIGETRRATELVNRLKQRRALIPGATEEDLTVAWLKLRREKSNGLLTRAGQTEVRHVCLYAADQLSTLRNEVIRPEMTSDLTVLELKEIIDDLQGLIAYLEGKGGGFSALHDRNA